MKYVGIWNGGAGYAPADWRLDAEGFASIQHAKSVLLGRYHNLPAWTAPRIACWGLDGALLDFEPQIRLATPGVSEGSSIELALIPQLTTGDSLLHLLDQGLWTHRVTIGPRGGVKVERAW